MKTKTINVKADFSADPYGRTLKDGPDNGQRFRETILVPALNENDEVIVDFEKVLCGPSFLDEAFAGIIRRGYYTKEELLNKLRFRHKLESYHDDYNNMLNEATYEIDKDTELSY
ncbi:MAG: STAS-like domain-containing protein [Proteobacteria bacterium]|nr:DUF4325 domain-containing protein [Pseudomonadota bacterium]NOG61189.1 STAS-like domain-containing protein [Pseudomonadota bacterium]